MTAALDVAQRTALSNLIQKARSLLEVDLALTLEGDYGIHRSDGRIEEGGALALDASQAAVRIDLLDIVAFLRSEGETEPAAVERLIREAAFTHVNRLVALRVAEGLGILPEAIGNGLASQGFRDFAEIAPASADEEWERFRLFVRICADELSVDVPALFDPRNPLLELEPSTAAFSELIELSVAADKTIWSAPDALGWSYQFFNSAEERKEMRESSAPRNSRELAVRNQFFTPSYVVEFLVQNGLGAHLAASFPALADELPLLVEVPESRAEPIDLREVSALDPACGSGHFLLGAYDVLEAAWRHAGVQPDEAAPDIVRSLWGIDIDPRATQIAQAAVILRARRHCRTPLPKPNVICARSLSAGPETDDLIAALPSHVGRVVQAIADELVMAPVLGPLLKIEERLDRGARDAFGTGQVEGTLSEGLSEDNTANVESLVLETLAAIADQTTSTASQRLFAAEAYDAVRFVEAMNRRYTACLMNPPFGDPVPATRDHLKKAYPANSTRTADLFASFVDRGRSLVEAGGSLGAITTRAGLFLQSYDRWRQEVFLDNGSIVLADLGFGVMEQAMVEACAYVLRLPREASGSLKAFSVLDSTDRPAGLHALIEEHRSGSCPPQFYDVPVARLEAIPGARVAYWAGVTIGALFEKLSGLDSGDTVVRRGLQTGDDFRFIRLDWELAEDDDAEARWRPFAKGGPYKPYIPDSHLRADWKDDGAYVTDFAGSVVPSPQLYFKGGGTWTYRTNSAFAPRVLQEDVIFSSKGPGIIGGNPRWLVAYLNSRVARTCVETMVAAGETTTSGSASRSYDTGLVGLIPTPRYDDRLDGVVESLWASLVDLASCGSWADEPLRTFTLHPTLLKGVDAESVETVVAMFELQTLRAATSVIHRVDHLDEILLEVVCEQAGLQGADLDAALRQTVGAPLSKGTGSLATDDLTRLWGEDLDSLIDELVDAYGGSRNVANLSFHAHRRLEVISHALEVAPGAIVDSLASLGTVSPEFRLAFAERFMSWLVAKTFGRDKEPDFHEGVESIFILQERPPRADDAPDVLLDQEGHPFDLTDRLAQLADAAHLSGALADSLAVCSTSRSLRAYIQRMFFGQHLTMYSMSRRKAPIYWQLQVPSKKWGIWLYMPRLSREMLFAVVRETEQRQRLAEQRIATLQREYDDGSAGRTIAAVSKELDAEQKLAVELVTFRDEAERIANLGWEPDLDDGAVLNAAPLASLFPAWKDAAKYRKELKQGKHTWSTVSKYADQL